MQNVKNWYFSGPFGLDSVRHHRRSDRGDNDVHHGKEARENSIERTISVSYSCYRDLSTRNMKTLH
jgi:hypothetical protein